MKRILVLILPILLLSAACGDPEDSGSAPAPADMVASVAGDTLDRDTFTELLDAVAENEGHISRITEQATQMGVPYEVYGEGGVGTYSQPFTTEILSQWIFYTIVKQQAEEEELSIDGEVRRRAEVLISYLYAADEIPSRSALGDLEPLEEGTKILEAFDPVYHDLFIEGVSSLIALEMAYGTLVSDEDVEAYYAENKAEFEFACAAHILVTPDAEANDPEAALEDASKEIDSVVAELGKGGDFAELASKHSDDPGSATQGGDLGCMPKGQYVPEFEEAVWSLEIGKVSEPVKTDFGFHLIMVDERGTSELEEVMEQIRSNLASEPEAAFNEKLKGWVLDADVVVDDTFGKWNPQDGVVDPPVDPSATTTLPPGLDLAPVETVPTATVPTETVPTETVPTETGPTTTGPATTGPTTTARTED